MRTSLRNAFVLLLTAAVTSPAHAAQEAAAATTLPAVARGALSTGRVALPADRVLHDAVDGTLWTSTASYKASFDAQRATFVPFLGSSAPRNEPVGLELSGVRVDGVDLAFESAPPTRAADRVAYERRSVREVYDLSSHSMEQSFVFDALPRRGELVVDVHVDSDLERGTDAEGLVLSGDRGGVHVRDAVAFDAAGRSIALELAWTADGYSLHVPADFVAAAQLPLVVDPTFTTFVVSTQPADSTIPDVSCDPLSGVAAFVLDYAFSAGDHDVYILLTDANGTWYASAILDPTSEDWRHPSVAFNAASRKYLVVAEVGAAPNRSIRGRTIASDISSVGLLTTFSTGFGDHSWPDAGGDVRTSLGTSRFCVVWQRELSASQTDIAARIVDPHGLLVGGMHALESGLGFVGRHPSVSKSTGDSTTPHGWVVAWDRTLFGSDRDIVLRQVAATGVMLPVFGAQNTSADDAFPSVSSLITAGTDTVYMVAYQRANTPTDRDIVATVCVGNAPAGTYVLTPGNAASQIAAAVETDGTQFWTMHMDAGTVGSTLNNLRLDQWYFGGSSLINTSASTFGAPGSNDVWPQLALDRSSGGAGTCGYLTWQLDDGTPSDSIVGVRYCGDVGGPSFHFCGGDGTDGTCPCGNNGAAGRGCANSAVAAGAYLAASGVHSTTTDTTVLSAAGMPPTTSCLFFQGTAGAAASAFGDGLRCVSGSIVRIGTRTANAGTASYPANGEPSVSVRGLVPAAGGRRYYQVWYRNAASFCLPASFNVSSGVIVEWTR